MHLSDAHHFRKMLAGGCMILAPVFLLVATIVHPESTTDEGAQLTVIADNLDAWLFAHVLALVAIAFLVPAVLGLMHMLREREVSLGHLGGGLAMIGLLAYVGIVAIEGFVGWQMGEAGDRAAMVALLSSIYDSAGIVIPFFVMSLGFALGMVCLALGLYRARAVQSWMAICLAAGAVLLAIGTMTATNWLGIVAAAFLVVGFGSIGRMVYRESDEAWEHTPEYEGFRPMPGMR